MDEIPPIAIGEDYSFSYRAPYKDKVVLEIGADIGSSASYFLKQGATKVYSVEGNKRYYDILVENIKQMEGKVEPIHMQVEQASQLKELLEKYQIDILHMDCEGCECLLLELDDTLWLKIPIFDLEIHWDMKMLTDFVARFLRLNYEVLVFTLDPKHGGYIMLATKMSGESQCTFEQGYRI
jgi:hypothetical protein